MAMIPVAFFGTSIGAGEILLILVVVLLLFGAERLPSIARSLGRALEEFRRAARDLAHDVMDDNSPPKPPPSDSTSPRDPSSDHRQG